MTLIFRALWQDTLPDVTTTTAREYISWITDARKWGGVVDPEDVPYNGRLVVPEQRNGTTVRIEVATTHGDPDPATNTGRSYRADLIETYDDPDIRWHTTIRSWEALADDGTPESWTWIDNEVVGDLQPGKIVNAAPRIVRSLLDCGLTPHIAGTPLSATPTSITGHDQAETLGEDISNPDRVLPIVVINDNERSRSTAEHHQTTVDDLAQLVARSAAGIAAVYLLDDPAATTLTEALGRTYGVWGGVLRIYLPGVDPADEHDAYRHRYFFPDRYCASRRATQSALTNRVAPISTLRRPPPSYSAVKRILDSVTSGNDAALLVVADAELRSAEEEILSLRHRLQSADEMLEELAVDLAVALEERALLAQTDAEHRRHIASLQTQLVDPDLFFETESEQTVPAICESPSRAAELARHHLSDHLVVPDTALVDLDALDAAVTSMAWGQTSWEAFQALHAYASDRTDGWDGGGFWEWCKTSGNPKAWRASSKKLSMRESESVRTRDKFRRAREFAVPKVYARAGFMYMEAHMKIAEGGGDLAPRIYFSPDLVDGRIIVGLFGPHRRVPNTKS